MKMKLSTKLIGGFMFVAFITAVVGGIGFWGVERMGTHIHEIGIVRLPSVQYTLTIEAALEEIVGAQRTLLNPTITEDVRQEQYAIVKGSRARYQNAWDLYLPLPQTPEEKREWDAFALEIAEWREANDTFFDLIGKLEATGITNPEELLANIQRFRGDHYDVETNVLNYIMTGEDFNGGEDSTACNFGKWVATFKSDNPTLQQAAQATLEPHRNFHDAVRRIRAAMQQGNAERAQQIYSQDMRPSARLVFEQFYAMIARVEEAQELYRQANYQALVDARAHQVTALEHLEKVIEINVDVSRHAVEEADADAVFAEILAVVAAIIGVIAALLFGILLSMSISKSLNQIIDSLNEGSDQVASAAGQVSGASQSLAEGATEQAASLEETSSALEEMASMARQNADNSNNANREMADSREQVQEGSKAVTNMATAMGEISDSSDKISNIIKTIEEIAFQTNLLALNAAVEAARAGDAGKGFAVVADEVRNLAQRAGQAARDTASLIEGTVTRVRNGTEIVEQLESSFGKVEASAGKVANLIAEISAASNEQAQGVDQVNTAVAQMDKVTQSNAANAEESASASEELSAQAEQMRQVVGDLMALVSGSSERGGSQTVAHRPTYQLPHGGSAPRGKPMSQHARLGGGAGAAKPGQKKLAQKTGPAVKKSNDVIPFDDDDEDFSDF